MSDGGDRVAVYLLDERCRIVEVHAAAVDPYDPEDLAVGPTAPSGSATPATTGTPGPPSR